MADISDLSKNDVVRWQHKWYVSLLLFAGFVLPMVIAGVFWGDWLGGLVYAGAARLCFVHHVSLRFRVFDSSSLILIVATSFSSLPSVSTLLLTGLARLPLTTSTLLVTI